MRVARQTPRTLACACVRRTNFLPVMQQISFFQTALQKSTGIHAWGTVGLKKHQVAQVVITAGAKEMVEAGFKQIGRTGITGNVATQLAIRLVGPHHHGQSVPAHIRGQTLLHGQVAWKHRLAVHRNGVDIRRDQIGLPTDATPTRELRQLIQYEACALWAVGLDQCLKGITPFSRFAGIGVGGALVPSAHIKGCGCIHAGYLRPMRTKLNF